MKNRIRSKSMKSLTSAAETGLSNMAEAHHSGGCTCFIIPPQVLEKFAKDKDLTDQQRQYFADAAKLEQEWRRARTATAKLATMSLSLLPTAVSAVAAAATPSVVVFDCQHGTTLPGVPVINPGSSTDGSAKRTFNETTQVVNFYKTIFGRNSLDNAGMTLLSSIHFSVNYNNAGWTGTQMKYGDGDGNIFIDFTKSNDVIGHELAHGVTQFTSGFAYINESGGLNESMSDVFGSMFRQWRANQTVSTADWLIGKEIMGPGARSRGFTCLRDMANPAATHCLSPQPTKFSQYHNGMDPHDSSGIPNFAFYKAAKAIGGKSWEKTGKIWYQALAGFAPSPNMKMKTFADRTRKLAGTMFPADASIKTAVDNAWKAVGIL
ncbi:MAG: M4 family metallopeptidase [Pyrinomonadaceae bacterium]